MNWNAVGFTQNRHIRQMMMVVLAAGSQCVYDMRMMQVMMMVVVWKRVSDDGQELAILLDHPARQLLMMLSHLM